MLSILQSIESDELVSGALLLVDKPQGWTSFDAVNKIKNLVRRKYNLKKFKIGHSGTLDPMATGLLVVCTGAWTKQLHHLQGLDKKYSGEITLGVEMDTYDAEGKVVFTKEVPSLTLEYLITCFKTFIGDIQQLPPAFSAIKKEGKPLYELARAGKEVKLEPRNVTVHSISIIEYNAPKITLEVHSGSGFYVRSLAHDIGAMLDCGAHLSALRRTAIGEYSLDDALSMNEIITKLSN
ncbi:MAG: tRNA pseudouridine(55) synthase TruB [Saprospiraceae bacterium]|uniref:tRNA pseudouridine synthase B n=1 Tax=Candidatus Opimibacter skivensis TaxID=2982028 RepID=A0A9D7SS23_9BACT|nr:tRNA pseudouridine(55) synthase TruB [Candidatus Opimibacter skivensis]